MFKKIKSSVLLFIIVSPTLIFAEGLDFKNLSKGLYEGIITSTINLLFTAAVVFFAWSVFKVVISVSGEKDSKGVLSGGNRSDAKDKLFWSVIALFVMFSVWGLVGILNDTFFERQLTEENFEWTQY